MPMLNRKGKASEYFSPHQLGVACQYGVEKVVHGLRCCVEEQGNEDDLVVTKIDLRNAFNLVSRQMLLDECNLQFSELFPWAAWFYSDHPLMCSAMGTLRSESGVQQGNPLGPLQLVLHKPLISRADPQHSCKVSGWARLTTLNKNNSDQPRDIHPIAHPVLWHPLGIISSETGVQQGDPLGPLLFSLVIHRVVSAIASNCPELLFHMWYPDDGAIAGPKLAVLRALSIVQDLGPPNGLFVNTSKCELCSTGDLSIFPSEIKSSKVLNVEIIGVPIDDFVFCAKYASQKRAEAQGLLHMLEDVGSIDPQVALLLLRQCGSFLNLFNALIPPADAITLDDIVSSPCRQHALSSRGWQWLWHDKHNTRPADVLVPNWSLGKPAAFDLTNTSPLNPSILSEAGVTAGSAALVAEYHKHDMNDPKCSESSWKCTPQQWRPMAAGVLRPGKHYCILPLI
ncbi:hypothetical protein EMCRGX_G033593 [Ephydatia muelleri]